MNPRIVLSLIPDGARRRWAVILGVTVLYVVIFQPITRLIGPVGAALVSIPVALAGLYFGSRVGLLAGLAGLFLNTLLLMVFEGADWFTWLVAYWPGNLMVMVLAYIAGQLHKGQAEHANIRDELHFNDRYLALISLATKNILDPNRSEHAYYYLVNHMTNLFVADSAHLVRWDSGREQAWFVASTVSSMESFSRQINDPAEAEILGSVVKSGRTLALEDMSQAARATHPQILTASLRSALIIPLKGGEYRFGAIVVGFDEPRRFTSQDIQYAGMAGTQVGLAFWAVQQELKIQKRLREANALANIERVLSETERVGIGTVLQLIVDYARELIPEADQAVLHMLDEERQILVPRAVSGFEAGSKSNLNMRLGEGVAGQVIASGEVIAIQDAQTDPRFMSQESPVSFRSLVVAPIQTNERRVGTISVQSGKPDAFSTDESQLLGSLGTQAAVAIENANLLETTQQNLKEINALYHASQSLAASLDPDQLMKDVADLLQKSFGYYHVQVFLLEPESGDLVARQGSGGIGDSYRAQGFRLPAGTGVAGHVAAIGKPFVTNDVEAAVFFARYPHLPDTQSELSVPIKVENKVVGVLDIQQVPPARLTERDMQLMGAVADQLAVSLDKANLYSELQKSLTHEKAIRSQLIQSERLAVVGRLLASVSHELNNPLQAIQNALFLLKEEEQLSDQGRQDLEIVLSETERMSALIERLRATYRPAREEEIQPVQLNDIIDDVCALTATHLRHKEIQFTFVPDPELPKVPGQSDQLRQVVLNLFLNAVEAMQTGGRLSVSTRRDPEDNGIQLLVTDTGPGIEEALLPHIFEPFVTSKDTGTGLGLTITYDIIQQHFGEIRAENCPEGGATFKVRLPLERKRDE